MSKPRVMLAIPTHDGRVNCGIVASTLHAGASLGNVTIEHRSAINLKLNLMYAKALRARAQGFTHFLMQHEDVVPAGKLWLDRLVEIADEHQAGILSAVIAIKNGAGESSVGIERDSDAPLGFSTDRVPLADVGTKYPKTFTHPRILLNTGLMLVDIRQPWAEKIWFESRDEMRWEPEKKFFYPVGMSEDWIFTKKARELGARLFATSEIPVMHHGHWQWGSWVEESNEKSKPEDVCQEGG